jgi:FkbM family methyltransferase
MRQDSSSLSLQHDGSRLSVPRRNPASYYETFVINEYRFLQPRLGEVVLDLGAGLGDFTVQAAQAVGTTGRVIAVEPSPDWLPLLHQNIRLNRLRNVVVVPTAAAGHKGILHAQGIALSTGGSIERASDGVGVPCDTVDSLLLAVGVHHVDVAKVDIEGAEIEIFKGQRFVQGLRAVAVETHYAEADSRVYSFLQKNGFSVRRFAMRDLLRNAAGAVLRDAGGLLRAEVLTGLYGARRLANSLLTMGGPLVTRSRQGQISVLLASRPRTKLWDAPHTYG